MNTDNDEENLKVIDTRHALTADELQELKRLVAMSKSAKMILAIALGFVSLIGFDQLLSILEKQ